MGKTLIKVNCIDQQLFLSVPPLIASGGVNEDEIEFSFCPLWDGFVKTVIFYRDKNTVYHVLLSNDKAVIPKEVLEDEGTLYFGVFGVSGNITRTSEIQRYKVKQGAITTGSTPPTPTPSIYEQVLAKLTKTAMLNDYANGYSKLPKLKLTGDISGMSKTNAKTLSFEYFAADAASANYSGYATVKWQGSSSLAYEKKNYTVKLFSDANCTTAQNIEFVTGWGAHNKYCLKANFIDHTHVRNIVAAKLWGECVKGRTDTEQSYVKLHGLVNGGAIDGYPIMLFINGTYAGLYTLNIPKEDWLFGMTGANTECVLCGEKWDTVTQFYSSPTAANIGGDDPSWDYEIEPADNSWVLSSLQAVYTALQMPMDTSEQTEAKITAMEACMDIYSVIDYCIMCDILGVTDNLGKNMLLVTFDGTKWMLSAYDLDTAFGNYWDGTKFIAPTDDTAGTDFTNNYLTWTISKLYAAKFNARRRYILDNIFRVDRIMEKIYGFHSFITSELMNGETLLYPSMPNANENGLQQIETYLTKRIAYKTNTFKTVYDQTLTAATSYVWIGDIGAQKLRIRLDYPTDGIGTAQNIVPYINDVPCVWLWHETTSTCGFFDVELCGDIIFSKAASGGSNYPTNAAPTTINTLSWVALNATSIPIGTRIRVYALG